MHSRQHSITHQGQPLSGSRFRHTLSLPPRRCLQDALAQDLGHRKDGLERSRMFVDRLPRPVRGHGRGWQRFRQHMHTIPFTDHASKPALMVFQNTAQIMYSPLPPLFPFVLYLTHPKTAPSPSQTEALVALYNNLGNSLLAFYFPFRLDIYFLPGGSEADCKAHYLAERASRLDLEMVLKLYRRLEFRYTRREDKLRWGRACSMSFRILSPTMHSYLSAVTRTGGAASSVSRASHLVERVRVLRIASGLELSMWTLVMMKMTLARALARRSPRMKTSSTLQMMISTRTRMGKRERERKRKTSESTEKRKSRSARTTPTPTKKQ
ncbi:hypothetical protein BJX70DRAFT_45544 [Aspergillus crustosus]